MKYQTLKNAVKAQVISLVQSQPTGLLAHPEDARDHNAEELGVFMKERKRDEWSIFDGLILNQQPDNTCVFFSRAQGASHQQGIHLSARWLVVVAYRNGWLSKDGFSTLEVGNKIPYNIGYVPEYECPSDRSRFSSFKHFVSMENAEFIRLSKIAEKFRTSEYRKIHTDSTAYEALDNGHTLFVGYKWYSNNNYPARFNYVLPFTGSLQGGHACELSGYKMNLKENPQTFGKQYGKNGMVYTRDFSHYGIYIEDMLPLESRLEAWKKQYEGKMVKVADHFDDPKCYVIQDGVKHHVRGDDGMKTFFKLKSEIGLSYVQKELLDAIPEGNHYEYV
jgi:hypothetical protein